MDIMEMGASLLSQKLGMDIDPNVVASALGGLLSNSSGDIDFAGIASKMASSGDLGAIVGSWLGDGANQSISAESITSIFGSDKIAEFAGKLGTDAGTATSGLADVLPQMMDKSSSGGSLLEMAGGASGLLGAAKSLFG
ncbi:YidB family protein [Congregibacter variabilis]|uniref:YidB family protein n=1 Tax=Congregibacter variabilis TaxID=3081200 RepID=A0ABZ0I3L7_9GAMM|nr:YidB family protein [Congregibacter sp. IMCC43200]